MVGLKKRGVITAVAGILAAVIFMRVCSRRSMSRFMQA